MEHQLDRADYAALIEARVRAPESLQSANEFLRPRFAGSVYFVSVVGKL